MRPAAPFAQVLDEALAGFAASPHADRGADPQPSHRSASGAQAPFRPAPVLGFFDFTVRHTSAPGIPHRRPSPYATATPRVDAPRPRVVRTLSPRQHDAVAELVMLGAALSTDFTEAELRRAHRLLARRYHPDRHPGCTESEKARLATLFTRAHEAYRVLHDAVAA